MHERADKPTCIADPHSQVWLKTVNTSSSWVFLVLPLKASITLRWKSCRTRDKAADWDAFFLLDPCSRACNAVKDNWIEEICRK